MAILGFAAPAPARAVPVETAPGRLLIPVAGGRASLDAGVALPEGGALLAGTVEGSGRVYVAKVTSTGALDPSASRSYRPRQIRRVVRIPFRASASAPGLARITLLAGRHLIARRIIAVTTAGTGSVQVQLPKSGRVFLRRHRRAPLLATLDFRSLFGEAASASAPVRVL